LVIARPESHQSQRFRSVSLATFCSTKTDSGLPAKMPFGNTIGNIRQAHHLVGHLLHPDPTPPREGMWSAATRSSFPRTCAAQATVDQNENHWLDVKSQHYDLASGAGQFG